MYPCSNSCILYINIYVFFFYFVQLSCNKVSEYLNIHLFYLWKFMEIYPRNFQKKYSDIVTFSKYVYICVI